MEDHGWMDQWRDARNSNVDVMNDLILSKLAGDIVTYTSIDNMMDQQYASITHRSLIPSGLLRIPLN